MFCCSKPYLIPAYLSVPNPSPKGILRGLRGRQKGKSSLQWMFSVILDCQATKIVSNPGSLFSKLNQCLKGHKSLGLSKLSEIVKVVRNCQSCQKLSMLSEIVKLVRYCQSCQKMAKLLKIASRLRGQTPVQGGRGKVGKALPGWFLAGQNSSIYGSPCYNF